MDVVPTDGTVLHWFLLGTKLSSLSLTRCIYLPVYCNDYTVLYYCGSWAKLNAYMHDNVCLIKNRANNDRDLFVGCTRHKPSHNPY